MLPETILGKLILMLVIHICILFPAWLEYEDDNLNDWQKKLLAWWTVLSPVTFLLSPIVFILGTCACSLLCVGFILYMIFVLPILRAIKIIRN